MKFLEILKTGFNEAPQAFGWFHLMMDAIIVAAAVLFCIFFKDASDKKIRKVFLICWLILISLELYKELTYRHDWIFDENGKLLRVEYVWYLFPYQFCSTPFYILPFIIFSKNEKVRKACMSYVSTFVCFAGLMILILPGDVFVQQIGICIQTMVQRGLQLILGILTTLYNRKTITKSFKNALNYYWPSVVVFAIMASIAIVLNEVVVATNLANGQTFNMFFISRHFDCTLVLLRTIYKAVPYPVFLVGYLIGFALVGAIIYSLQVGIYLLVKFITSRIKKQSFAESLK